MRSICILHHEGEYSAFSELPCMHIRPREGFMGVAGMRGEETAFSPAASLSSQALVPTCVSSTPPNPFQSIKPKSQAVLMDLISKIHSGKQSVDFSSPFQLHGRWSEN